MTPVNLAIYFIRDVTAVAAYMFLQRIYPILYAFTVPQLSYWVKHISLLALSVDIRTLPEKARASFPE
jgi:hypothetical protein